MSTLLVSYWATRPSDWLGSAWFRGFLVLSRAARRFESDLGHSVSGGQRRIGVRSVDKA